MWDNMLPSASNFERYNNSRQTHCTVSVLLSYFCQGSVKCSQKCINFINRMIKYDGPF